MRRSNIEIGICYLVFGFSLAVPFIMATYMEENNPYRNVVTSISGRIKSSEEYLPSIVSIYATLFSVGIPIAITIVGNALAQYKLNIGTIIIREREFRFQLFVVPVFIAYCLMLCMVSYESGIPMVVALIFVLYSIFRFVRFIMLLLYISSDTRLYVANKEREVRDGII